MKVILPDNETREFENGPDTVEDLLRELGINSLEVMVSKNGTLIPEQAKIGSEDVIRIIRIAHGG